jgi:hypothetical protein
VRAAIGASTVAPNEGTTAMAYAKIQDLLPGDFVDLFNDKFADPNSTPDKGFKGFEFEFEIVLEVVPETATCTRIDFESGFSCGFPPDHQVKIPD